MKRTFATISVLCLIALLAGSLSAREGAFGTVQRYKTVDELSTVENVDPGLRSLYAEAAVDTYCTVWYNFEQMNWQGWTLDDFTAQRGTFFHVDDFAGLAGGSFGRLVAIEGTKSMWCGARYNSSDPYMCGWLRAPGYGNNWEQHLISDAIPFTGVITLSYHGVFDSEPGFDYTYVEYDAGAGNWQRIAEYNAIVDTIASHPLPLAQAKTKFRFHFTADGAWCDEDGLWNTDGGAVIDSIRVSDSGGYVNFQDFEAAAVNAKDVGIWHAQAGTAFGSFASLRNNLMDKDPCGDNFGTQVVFFTNACPPSASYPGLYDTPFCTGPGGVEAPCQNEGIVSPIIDLTKYSTACNSSQNGTIPPADLPLIGGTQFWFTVYRDLPGANLVHYYWGVRNIDAAGCPGQWQNRNLVYYGDDRDYIQSLFDVSDLITENRMQMFVGSIDMCNFWYLQGGDCAEHTPSPWIDNVRLYRYKRLGPSWAWRTMDVFSDNFPSLEFDLESYIRADAAQDINPANNPVIRPGDSIFVDCTAPLAGALAVDNGWPAVYLHVKATYIGPAPVKPNLAGATLAGDYGRYYSDDGTWTIIQGDTARNAGGFVADRYMFDLNDELFTRGYRVEYYFSATDADGYTTTLPGPRARLNQGNMEFTCLPTLNSDVLFMDGWHGRGSLAGWVENYWKPTFEAVLPSTNYPDVYDMGGPSSNAGTGLGSRAKNFQLTSTYHKIIWDCGDLNLYTICDGSGTSDKPNDAQMLIDWMNLSGHDCGLWILGEGVAEELDALTSTAATELMETWCGVTLVDMNYFELTGGRTAGGVVSPVVKGVSGSIFDHSGVVDEFSAFGGCPIINNFDVLDRTANGQYALAYPNYGGNPYYAGIQSVNQNSGGFNVRTMWWGLSWMFVRDRTSSSPIVRNHLAKDVIAWMQNTVNIDISHGDAPAAFGLSQNYPNPFNPSTSIKLDMKERGFVTLKIYNVAGQLVRTLVNETKDAGSYTVTWMGDNDSGKSVASGVYFYKMETKDYSQTRKMVMLR